MEPAAPDTFQTRITIHATYSHLFLALLGPTDRLGSPIPCFDLFDCNRILNHVAYVLGGGFPKFLFIGEEQKAVWDNLGKCFAVDDVNVHTSSTRSSSLIGIRCFSPFSSMTTSLALSLASFFRKSNLAGVQKSSLPRRLYSLFPCFTFISPPHQAIRFGVAVLVPGGTLKRG